MNYGVRNIDIDKTKKYKIILGIIFGIVCLSTVGLGIFMIADMSLWFAGCLLTLGVVPAELFLTYTIVKNASVETISEELVIELIQEGDKIIKKSYYALGDEILERLPDEVVAIKRNGKYVNILGNEETKRTGIIQFTNIAPIKHSEEELARDKNNSRKRVIEFRK